jgi:hypothetical protein
MAYSAWTGGMIRHTEIRADGTAAPLARDGPEGAERD